MPFCSSSGGSLEILESNVVDFTTCFHQAILLNVPTAFLIVLGVPRLVFLAKRAARFPASARLYLEVALLIAAAALSVVKAVVASSADPAMDSSVLVAHIGAAVALLFAIPIQWLEHTKLPAPSSLITLFWFLRTLAGGLALRTYVRLGFDSTNPTFYTLFLASTLVSLVGTVVAAVPSAARLGAKELPENNSSVFSRATFAWMLPLLRDANRKTLTMDDIYDTSRFFTVRRLTPLYESLLAASKATPLANPVSGLTVGVVKRHWTTFALAIVGDAAALVCNFATPLFLSGLIAFVEMSSTRAAALGVPAPPLGDGLIYAIGMFLSTNLVTIANSYSLQLLTKLQLRMRTMLMSAIYRKALVLSLAARGEASVGEIVNRMSVDTNQVVAFLPATNDLWSMPITIALCLWFLFSLLGPSAFAGIVVVLVLTPLIKWSTGVYMRQNKVKLGTMDTRIKLLNEVVSGMKTVKLYGLEDYFKRKLVALRDTEQAALRRLWQAMSMMVGVTNSIHIMIVLFTFVSYSLIGDPAKPLTPQRVFVSMAYLDLLLNPIGALFGVIAAAGNALVSYRRIGEFLAAKEFDPAAVDRSDDSESPIAVQIADGHFQWELPTKKPETTATTEADAAAKESDVEANLAPKPSTDEQVDTAAAVSAAPFELKNINLTLGRGKLTAVVGRVGEGKSALLHAILGEMRKLDGTTTMRGTVAYVPQAAWIFNGTLRENIVFCSKFDEAWYNKVIEACALTPDVKAMVNGDATLIGDKGVTCSGGQQARISLARAVYSNKDIYLLDSVLSAVDAASDKYIFNNVLGPRGLLRKKSVILVTHGVHHLSQCDEVALLKDGTVAENGSYEDLMARRGDVYKLVTEYSTKDADKPDDTSSSSSSDDDDDDGILAGFVDGVRRRFHRGDKPKRAATKDSVVSAASSTAASKSGAGADESKPATAAVVSAQEDDDSLSGTVTWAVYRAYINACGKRGLILFVPCFLMGNAIMALHSYWLQVMSTAINDAPPEKPADLTFYLGVYGGLTALNVVVMATLALVSLTVMSVNASRLLHAGLIARVMRAPMSWFTVIPAGRIVNRFSSDISAIDESIPLTLINFTFNAGMILSTFAIIGISTPFVLILVPFAIGILFLLGMYYLKASRELKRMDSSTIAPVYQRFEETLHGLVSIRAYAASGTYADQMGEAIDRNNRARYLSLSLGRWLTVNSTALASLFILAVGLVAVFTRGSSTSAMIGLAITQAQSLVFGFRVVVNVACQMESEMVAVERVLQYSEVDQEAAAKTDVALPADWPVAGAVEFLDYSTTYRSDLPPVLRQVNVTIAPGTRSSLTLALFRIIEATGGSISIDGTDLSTLGLADLRSHLCIIPQDPQLFEGTLRDNLDPRGDYDDAAIWRALELSHMQERVANLEGKLQAAVATGGSSFSSGERQLLTLAAAILRKRRVVIFDEASGSLDAETDAIIQKTIREEFAGCTVLTIAHRINTIIDSDKILVLDEGRVAEYESPEVLLQRPESLFAKLVEDSRTH
ncbi:hypothetical protein H9P43_005924 [Blastocladiella emersonii ATCC 22665]|nr:hypothetical protein H9P43_005924 [Blastocladiella emersonii ATCC 22665]